MNIRPNWHQYFMKMAFLVAERSTCLRRQVGAIIVRNNQIISTGYNGAPKHVRHCAITGCLREKLNVPSGVDLKHIPSPIPFVHHPHCGFFKHLSLDNLSQGKISAKHFSSDK